MADDLTPAGELREAARLLRERAQTATPGPWVAKASPGGDWCVISAPCGQVSTGIHDEPGVPEVVLIERDQADADYIASMHPLVGLAVADWLDDMAADLEAVLPGCYPLCSPDPALAVARAYPGSKGESDA